ncbi:DUF6445 family protein [Chitinimonas sp.]|uniref:DUF6445 family protein n=1 Tax=Chitinimonas sp. TaxID=1934313 RepID=UPI0035AF06F5
MQIFALPSQPAPIPRGVPLLPYEAPQLGRNIWLNEAILPDPQQVAERCLAQQNWLYGFPQRQERWPGMRFHGALEPAELASVEAWVKEVTGARRLWVAQAPDGAQLDFNVAQLVGQHESGPRPHTDSLALCRYAAVIYLNRHADPDAGTSFYRLRYPNGAIGGNLCRAPHRNLAEALGVRGLPLQAWHEEARVANRFNRMVLYQANRVHSATRYFGSELRDKRLTAVFFWMAQ